MNAAIPLTLRVEGFFAVSAMKLAKILCATLILILAAAISGCSESTLGGSGSKNIAVCFPNTTESWQRNGDTLTKLLQEEGFNVDVQFSDTIEKQQQQVKDAIAKKPGCIVIAAIDSAAFVDVLEDAKKNNVPVIAFERMLLNSDAVSYYASFDGAAVGEAMGEYFESVLNLKSGAGPYNIEFFAGSTTDSGAGIYFSNAMKILEPYLRSGQLVCRSGQTNFEQVAVAEWNSANARPRIRDIFNKYYSDATLNVVLSPNDDIAGVLLEEFKAAGKPFPLISGLDGDPAAFDRIRAGQQTFTVAKDPEVLTSKCVRMIKAVVEGTQPDINDVTNYNNGVKVIPAYLCTPQIVDRTNVDIVAK